jgi:hypothetical protein
MKKAAEKVLLYQFADEEKLQSIQSLLTRIHIVFEVLPADAYEQKVGYLLGIKGFNQVKKLETDDFIFPFEVMVLYNIKNKRLEHVLDEFHHAGIESIRFKAIVTPFNMFWTFRRLCETMQKEHTAMRKRNEDSHEG